MKYTLSFKGFSWKRVGLAVLIIIVILFLTLLSLWYFWAYRPLQEAQEWSKKMDEFEKEFYTSKGLPLPDFSKTEPEF